MKKYGGSVGQRVDPVEHPSMTGNTVSHIFDYFVSIDRGDDYISRESGNCDKGTYQDDIRSGEGSQETEKVTNHSGTDYTTQKTLPCFVRTYFRKYLMPSQEFTPNELHDIIYFGKEYKEQQQPSSS